MHSETSKQKMNIYALSGIRTRVPQQSSGFRHTFQIARPPILAFQFAICSLLYHSKLY